MKYNIFILRLKKIIRNEKAEPLTLFSYFFVKADTTITRVHTLLNRCLTEKLFFSKSFH